MKKTPLRRGSVQLKRSWLKRKPNAKRKLELEADLLWKSKIMFYWGIFCEVCGDHASPPHHYIPKSRNALLRFDIANGVPLCQKHHYIIHFDRNPDKIRETVEAIRKNRGKDWCDYIDEVKNIHEASFRSVGYLQDIINMLK